MVIVSPIPGSPTEAAGLLGESVRMGHTLGDTVGEAPGNRHTRLSCFLDASAFRVIEFGFVYGVH
jgi:hypothetical protein